MGSLTFSTDVYIERLVGLENALQEVKCKLFLFRERIEEIPLKNALRKFLEYIPTSALAVIKKNTETVSNLLPENNPLNGDEEVSSYQRKKYCTFQPYHHSETIIVKKIPIKKKKLDHSNDCKCATNDKRPIQHLIAEIEKAVQNSHLIIESLVDAAKAYKRLDCKKPERTPILWRDINYAIKQLRFHISIILKGATHLNKHRQMPRLLSVLRCRATIINVISKLEEEGKQMKWKV